MNVNVNDISWKIIDMMFNDNKHFLVSHHIESYNDFFNKGLMEILKNKNPLRIYRDQDEMKLYKHKADLYIGGKDGKKIYYGKPVINDIDENNKQREHFMYPNEARLRNMTYAFTIHYDVEIDYTILVDNKSGNKALREEGDENEGIPLMYDVHKETVTLEKIYLGKFPIMLQSDLCLLNGLSKEVRFNMGECKNDPGGYFIIDGKEKAIISQEGRADNMLYVRDKVNDIYSHAVEIRSVSEDTSKPIRTLSIRMVAPQPSMDNGNIVVNVPNVRKPVPLFILMRALGVISDKEIIETCLLDMDSYEDYIELFRPSVHDANYIFSQRSALKYIALLTKYKTISYVMMILSSFLLPHIGELNFKHKALYIGYMVKRLLGVYTNSERKTDRDSYSYKRIEIAGTLIYGLFREYYKKEYEKIRLEIDSEYHYEANYTKYQGIEFKELISTNRNKIFGHKIVEDGFKKGFKGNWGADAHTKRLGLVQDLNRLSFFGFLCQLRKTNLPMSADAAKIVNPRLLHATQWGLLCPVHSPDGGNVGLHNHLSTSTIITKGSSSFPYIELLRKLNVKMLEECSLLYLSATTKVFVNGNWIGNISDPIKLKNTLKLYKLNSLIDRYVSVSFNTKRNEILVCTDAGRPMRPLYYTMNNNSMSYEREHIIDKLMKGKLKFEDLLKGGGNENNKNLEVSSKTDDMLSKEAALIEYVDTLECEGNIIAKSTLKREDYIKNKITHQEIHPSLVLGLMANQIIFPENNPYPRNAFSCGQGKQGVSLYHSNFRNRIDKSSFVLNSAQIPLTKSRYLKYATNEEHGYGENAIVAIMCYTGFNVEDAVIVNGGSLERGLFRTTYYNMYEDHEESSKVKNTNVDSVFMNIEENNVIGLKSGFDYSKLNKKTGLINENEEVNEKTIILGKGTKIMGTTNEYVDDSKVPKKGQTGVVDKAYISYGEEGKRIAKIRIRGERIPSIGDKFCSRAGQKGTIGIILPERDMPTTEDGIRPDIIVNPHAMPSRMTIGHLVETITSKVASIYGGFGDCTAFEQNGPKHELFGKALVNAGFHKTGNQVLYNGMTGEQLETEIYFGPTYYLRLKHMPKDKINYRARGPRTVLTRQTVQGRANNGGLRIGEMDRDVILAHGMSSFMKESMLVRGDEYYMAVCNNTGTIAIYNESKNLFISPMIDGPIKFTKNINNELNIVNMTRYGKNFSIVRVPYAFKLLMQELQAMNVQMRIITEDNVDQLTSMSGGNDVLKLTGLESLREVNEIIRKKQNKAKDMPFRGTAKEEITLTDKDIMKDYEEGQAPGLIRHRHKLSIGDIVTFDKSHESYPDNVKHPNNNYSVIQIDGEYPNNILMIRGEDGESLNTILENIERKYLVLVRKWEPSILNVGSKVKYLDSYLYAVETMENGKEEVEKLKGVFTVIDIKPDLDNPERKEYVIQREEDKESRIIKDKDLDVIVEQIREESPMLDLPSQQVGPRTPEIGPTTPEMGARTPEASPLQIYSKPGMTPPMDPDSPPFVVGDVLTPPEIQDVTSTLQYDSPNVLETSPMILGVPSVNANPELQEEELLEENEEEKVKTYTIKEEPDTDGLSVLLPKEEDNNEGEGEEGDDVNEGEIKKI